MTVRRSAPLLQLAGIVTRSIESATFPIQILELLAAWGGLGTGPGQFNSPSAVAVDATGNAYVADSFNHRIQAFGDPPPTVPERQEGQLGRRRHPHGGDPGDP